MTGPSTVIPGPAVDYPSYVDFDPLIDVERLRSLDDYVRDRLERRLADQGDLAFYTGPFVLGDGGSTLPGSKLISLAESARPDDYYDLDACEHWHPSKQAEEFPAVMEFIATLPFAATARIIIIYDPVGQAVTAHRDHDSPDLSHEFIWLRTNLDKPFFMLDPGSGEKRYIAGHSAWFDTVNQYHGGDSTGELAWSIRVDGRFNDALRAMIPTAPGQSASRAALWASGPNAGVAPLADVR